MALRRSARERHDDWQGGATTKARLEAFWERLRDDRSGRILVVSHCLLNQNVRYLGGAVRPGLVEEVIEDARRRNAGIHQMPCPEQRAWGGALKQCPMLIYSSTGTLRYRMRRPLLRLFIPYTRARYSRLARRVARDVRDYVRSGFEVVGVLGVAGSPSCGVSRTLDLARAMDRAAVCPLDHLEREAFNKEVVAANVVAGEGLFVRALRRALRREGIEVPFREHDLAAATALRGS